MSDKEKILIADDSAMNRAILTEMLGDGYELLEAENGRQAVAILQSATDIDLLLLDIMMPEMDGFEVLAMMNKYHWIDEVPVIMISAENASSYVERAYDLGATDYISRPFDMAVVRRRVINTLMLYAKQKRLVRLVAEQVYEKEKSNSTMINILSHIVEFRNGESGMHVLHIQTATDILLHTLVQKTDKYHLTAADISLISTASALHDIGKINIPESILNKPGRLTKEEFEVMKTHTTIGSEILEKLPFQQESDLVKTAYAICRWHHERWDGRGYPDGLEGRADPHRRAGRVNGRCIRRIDERALLQKSVRPRYRGEDDPERGVRAVQPAAAGMPDRVRRAAACRAEYCLGHRQPAAPSGRDAQHISGCPPAGERTARAESYSLRTLSALQHQGADFFSRERPLRAV